MSALSISGGTSYTSITADFQKAAVDQAQKAADQRTVDAKQQAQVIGVKDAAKQAQLKSDDAARLQSQQQARVALTAFYTQGSQGLDLRL